MLMINGRNALITSIEAVETKVDTANTNLGTVETKVDTANTNIGTPADDFNADTLHGRAEGTYQHVHQTARVRPSLTAGVPVEAGDAPAGWDLGDFVTVVAEDAIVVYFDIHWINVESMTHNGTYELVLYAGDPDVEIARVRFTRVDNFTKRDAIFAESPVIEAGSRIRAKVACSDAGAGRIATISIGYHTYS